MSFELPPDPYLALGVSKDDTLDTIKKKWRKLAIENHPDKVRDESLKEATTEKFQKIDAAYKLLSDADQRARYDNQIKLQELRRSRPAHYSEARPSAAPSTSYRSPRPFEDARFEDARFEDARFEERVPRYAAPSFEDEVHSYPRNMDDFDRKASGGYSERKGASWKAGEIPIPVAVNMKKRATQAREKVKERDVRNATAKAREQGRRRDASYKYDRHTFVEAYSSDTDDAPYSRSEKKSSRVPADADPPRRSRAEARPRRSRPSDDEDRKHQDQHAEARDYIIRSSSDRPQPPARQNSSHSYFEPRPDDRGHRRTASDRDDRRPSQEERPRTRSRRPSYSEEPEFEQRSPKTRVPPMPAMPSRTSAPVNLRNVEERQESPRESARESTRSQRATTQQSPREYRNKEMPSMSRSKTMPLSPGSHRRGETGAPRPSNLKHTETQDSGYGSSSPTTPEMHSTQSRPSARYTIVDEAPEHTRESRPTILIDDEDIHRHRRSPVEHVDPLPSSGRSKSSRVPAGLFRSSSDMPRPSPSRHESTRSAMSREQSYSSRGTKEKKPLFREMSSDEGPYKHRSSSERVSRSKKSESAYQSSPRRPSYDTDRADDYPRSRYDGDFRSSAKTCRPPPFSRRQSLADFLRQVIYEDEEYEYYARPPDADTSVRRQSVTTYDILPEDEWDDTRPTAFRTLEGFSLCNTPNADRSRRRRSPSRTCRKVVYEERRSPRTERVIPFRSRRKHERSRSRSRSR